MLFDEKITLPLGMNQLQKVLSFKADNLKDETIFYFDPLFIVNYKDSSLKGKFFINYVSNLKLSILMDHSENLSKEEKFDLMKEYILSSNNSLIPTFNACLAAVLLENKGVDVGDNSWLNKQERKEFFILNQETLEKWERFLESIPYSLPFCVEHFAQSLGKKFIEEGQVELIDDPNYVGKNIAYLTLIPDFIEFYISLKSKHKPALFEPQWFEPIFSGHSMLNFMITGPSSLFPFMTGLFDDWFKPEDLKNITNSKEYKNPEQQF
jgi:hypothetical protein